MSRVEYYVWEDDPVILQHEDDGRVTPWWYAPDASEWEVIPLASVVGNARKVDEKTFQKMFPKVSLPEGVGE